MIVMHGHWESDANFIVSMPSDVQMYKLVPGFLKNDFQGHALRTQAAILFQTFQHFLKRVQNKLAEYFKKNDTPRDHAMKCKR